MSKFSLFQLKSIKEVTKKVAHGKENNSKLQFWTILFPNSLCSILTMSMEFDKNFSYWSLNTPRMALKIFLNNFLSKLLDPPNCKILTFKVIFYAKNYRNLSKKNFGWQYSKNRLPWHKWFVLLFSNELREFRGRGSS